MRRADRPPSSERRQLELAAVGVGEVGDDGMAEAGAGLGLVEPAAADDGLGHLLGRQARAVVVDADLEPVAGAVGTPCGSGDDRQR